MFFSLPKTAGKRNFWPRLQSTFTAPPKKRSETEKTFPRRFFVTDFPAKNWGGWSQGNPTVFGWWCSLNPSPPKKNPFPVEDRVNIAALYSLESEETETGRGKKTFWPQPNISFSANTIKGGNGKEKANKPKKTQLALFFEKDSKIPQNYLGKSYIILGNGGGHCKTMQWSDFSSCSIYVAFGT